MNPRSILRVTCRGFAAATVFTALGAGLPGFGPHAAPGPAAQDPNAAGIGIKITGSSKGQIPIAVTEYQTTAGSPDAAGASRSIQQIISRDLMFSGLFNVLPDSLLSGISPVAGRIPLKDYAALGAEGVAYGTVGLTGKSAPELVVEGLLFDSRSESLISGKRYRGGPDLTRSIAHRIANDIQIAYTGRSGVATTRLVFVGRVGGAKELFVVDYDGANLRQITKNGSLNLSPAWSPDGRQLAYVSYAQGTPRLYLYSAEDGTKVNATPAGSDLCSAPEWSPDGQLVAFSSAREGNSEIYVLDVASNRARQITFSRGADTAPTWSPSGRELAFTSDRSGRPQIYIMDAEGANARAITTGEYNESASWSPAGDRIAYVSRSEGRFDIYTRDLTSGSTLRLTQGSGNNENPRWSPDGRHIVFSSNRTRTYRLHTMDADGNRQEAIDTGMDSTMPDWSH